MIRSLLTLLCAILVASAAFAAGVEGYYRYPALHGETMVFAAEGDLWTVPLAGGAARRLTTHPGEESHPTISPDGRLLAFSASYEGTAEVYTMPLTGGLPTRRSWEAESSEATTWRPDGALVYTTMHYSTLPDLQLVALDLKGGYERIPLSQASEGAWDESGEVLYFVRPAFHRNVTKRYKGGTARQVWRFVEGAGEAEVLTGDYAGESHTPMWWAERVYFISDRDGTMNIWSMDESGGSLRQETRQSGWDVRDAALSDGRIVYQAGADLWLYDIAAGAESLIPITLATDVDQWREKWIDDPMEYLTSARIHPEGESVVLTTRGRVFVAPASQGRLVRASTREGVRYRDVVFMPDGEQLLALSDESSELEFVLLPANGVGAERQLTADGTILRFEGVPSPGGERVAYSDQNRDLWVLDVESGERRLVSTNRQAISAFSWSPDGRWLAFGQDALNSFTRILLWSVDDGSVTELTSDRVNSWSPVWDPAGEWLYFLSDRALSSRVRSPWGARQPEAYFGQPDRIFQMALRDGLRSPFKPKDELEAEPEEPEASDKVEDAEPKPVEIDLEGIQRRVRQLPVPPGDYNALGLNESALFWLARSPGRDGKWNLEALAIGNEDPEVQRLVSDVRSWDLARNGKKLLVHSQKDLYVLEAAPSPPSELGDHRVDLSGWSFAIDARQDWRQIFIDAWRLERDHFYDPGMHGVDWEAVRDKYLPLVDRVTTRAELSELIGRVVGELSALHTSVRGGDHREGPEDIDVGSLGARLVRDADGYRIEHIYEADPDYPEELSPLADPDLGIALGDVVLAINGVDVLSVDHPGVLLRNQVGRQVRVRVRSAADGTAEDHIVVPIEDEWSLRYRDWKYSRRRHVEERGGGKLGYVHLRNMGGNALDSWYRQFYPVFDRQGLILDMRHNTGGNIDSLILEKLMRRAWFYWKGRVEEPYWNQQYAFRGHMVVLQNQRTASDGEAFTEGFRRLGLGKIIGTRTWGGEIWLSSSNRLTDRGIARAPMWGVYGPEGEWLIEGHGVEPDIEVDNLPHATFNGEDAQLDAAIDHLLGEIERDPRPVPAAPPYPDLSFDYPEGDGGGR
jgi:tricorn protease